MERGAELTKNFEAVPFASLALGQWHRALLPLVQHSQLQLSGFELVRFTTAPSERAAVRPCWRSLFLVFGAMGLPLLALGNRDVPSVAEAAQMQAQPPPLPPAGATLSAGHPRTPFSDRLSAQVCRLCDHLPDLWYSCWCRALLPGVLTRAVYTYAQLGQWC